MLISHSHKFIFIHNYKVAGTSIRAALLKYGPWYRRNKYSNYLYDKIDSKINPNYIPGHAKAMDIKKELGTSLYDDFFKFCFVRNPWDWQVSLYFYILKQKKHYQHDLVKSMNSFEEYIEWRISEDLHLQHEFFEDNDGNIIVDYIGKYENLQQDFAEICKIAGIVAELPHKNKTVHKAYVEYYNDYTRSLVEEHYKKDIEMFGYYF